jgi:predicted RNase H-like HicB family nuclease
VRKIQLTRIIEREGDGYVALCPQLDIASEGNTVEEARANLTEAVEGFLEVASEQELRDRLTAECYIENLEVTVA